MKTVPLDYCIETERLFLQIPQVSEVDFVWDATRYPSFNDGMVWDKPEAKEDLVEFAQSIPVRWEKGECFTFTFKDRDSRELIGRIAVEHAGAQWSVGYWTHPKYQGAGYATEALEGVLEFCFVELGLKTVIACHAEWNVASRKVLERNGFRFTRHVEEGLMKNGEWVAEDFLALSLNRWRAFRKER